MRTHGDYPAGLLDLPATVAKADERRASLDLSGGERRRHGPGASRVVNHNSIGQKTSHVTDRIGLVTPEPSPYAYSVDAPIV